MFLQFSYQMPEVCVFCYSNTCYFIVKVNQRNLLAEVGMVEADNMFMTSA